MQLPWLPTRDDWDRLLRSAKELAAGDWAATADSREPLTALLRQLAGSRMEFSQVVRLDRTTQRIAARLSGELSGFERVRLAVLGSATTSHLSAGIRVAGLRRGLNLEIYEAPYGMYRQELMNPASALHDFEPEVVLLALDARHLAAVEASGAGEALDLLRSCWQRAQQDFRCQIVQQTLLPVFPNLLGHNEERLPSSPAAIVSALNEQLRQAAVVAGVDLLALDRLAAAEGMQTWHDASLWHHSKHEVRPAAAEHYGEQVARLIAAARGRSAKVLVLDLDNTLWGGVIGDDGLAGIVLGQGSGTGEAFVEFQRYCKALSERGVVLAVCSKNDEANARAPFEQHPDMVLRANDIACFTANWEDKATNLRRIARQLNLGLDALVFVDDNPAERALVRRELPLVAVPELPEDPASYAGLLASAGYFEGLCSTGEDAARGSMYRANARRESLRDASTDMDSYLESLDMRLSVAPIDRLSLARATQLLNKTNQFNLMTERLSEAEVAARMEDPGWIALQARLSDRFGDNGVIAVLMARVNGQEAILESWLMSCRVLGRRVEEGCLKALAEVCAAHGVRRLVGQYRPTEKNGMVRGMYSSLGFTQVGAEEGGIARWTLDLAAFEPKALPLQVEMLREALA